MKKFLQKYYLKIRIVLTFCVVTFLLVLIMSQVSYHYSRDSYLNQVSDHAKTVTGIVAKQIESKYLTLLKLGTPGKAIHQYFRNLINKYDAELLPSEFFIFNASYKILVYSGNQNLNANPEPRLLLNQSEIRKLAVQSSISTMPFKGNDGNWYLWAFFRIDDNLWLGMQESVNELKKVEELFRLFWYIGLGGIVLTVILGFVVAASITKPIDRLTQFSADIGKGDFNSPQPEKIKGELKILSDAMDKMRNNIINNQKEKEEILAQIAHEIRNPLGSIELMANLTKEDMASGKLNTEYLNRILSEISDLKALITAYLNYSRSPIAKPDNINLLQLVDEVFTLFREQLIKKNISFDKQLFAENLFFDAGHLKQILINLISNSIEAIGENGSISITSQKVNNKVQLVIRDSGNGISVENLEKVFDPFFTTRKNGTGLGLAICKKLCLQNEATIEVFNKPGSGCEFVINSYSGVSLPHASGPPVVSQWTNPPIGMIGSVN